MTYSNLWFIKFRSHLTGPNATALLRRHNGRDGISNHQPYACLLNHLFMRIKENIKVPHHWPPCGEFTGNRWTPRTSDQQHGRRLHLMTSPREPRRRPSKEQSLQSIVLEFSSFQWCWSAEQTINRLVVIHFHWIYVSCGLIDSLRPNAVLAQPCRATLHSTRGRLNIKMPPLQ